MSSQRILVVEDDPRMRRLVLSILKSGGYRDVKDCQSEAEALTLAGAESVLHLLVIDVNLVGAQGTDVANKVRGLHPGLQVLFMSGYDLATLATRGVKVPPSSFLYKPFTPAAMLERVRELLN